jgi:hypothetical protein
MTANAKTRWLAVPFTELVVMLALLGALAAGAVYNWQRIMPVFVGPGADEKLLALDLGTARDWSLDSFRTYTVRFERNDRGRVEGYVVECQLKQAGPPVELLRRKIAADVEVKCSRLIVEFLAGSKTANAAKFEISNHHSHRRWTIVVDSPGSSIVLHRA